MQIIRTMKKLIFSLTLWLISTGCTWADGFIIDDVTIPNGGTVELPIGFLFDSGAINVGFQLNIVLLDGISTLKDEDMLPVYVEDESSCGKLTFLATKEDGFAAFPQTTSSTIRGTSGTLITITLQSDGTLDIGTELTATVTNAMFSAMNEDGSTYSNIIDDFTFKIIIGEPDDGRVKFNENATSLPKYVAACA